MGGAGSKPRKALRLLCAAGDATRDHPPPSDACHPRPPSLPPPPPFDSVPEKSLPQSPSPPLPASPKPPSSHLRAKNPIPPPSIPPLHAPEAPTGCDSFPRRQRIPNLLRLSARRGQSNSAGHLFSDIHRYPVDHTLPTGLPYPRYRFEEPCPRSSQETEAGHCFPPTFEELVTCRWLLAAPSWRQNVFSGKAWWGVMGAFCSCLQADYSDHHGNQASGAFRNCMCLRCFTQQLINAYTVLFRVGTVHAVSQAIEATPIDSSESSFDTYRSPPRPLPYDDPRFSPPLRDWFASRHDASSHSPEESEPLRADFDEEMETMSSVDKPSKTNYDTKMKRGSSAYGDKLSRKESGNYYTYFSPSAEDEDVCPTCLEDYTSENPRIVMQCSHHFHLGCIYEWMERSEACPVCGKKMEFNETT